MNVAPHPHRPTVDTTAAAPSVPDVGPLADWQVGVLQQAGHGGTTEQIAKALKLPVHTVRRHLRSVLFALGGAKNRIQAYALAWQFEGFPRTVPVGEAPHLTEQQQFVLRIWAAGGTRVDVQRLLRISPDAAYALGLSALHAFHADRRIVAVRGALEHGLIPGDEHLDSLREAAATLATAGADRNHARPQGEEGEPGTPRSEPRRGGIAEEAPTGHLANQLRTANALLIHLDALAGVPEAVTLAQLLNGAATAPGPAHVVARLVHQALARGIPCALIIPPGATDPAKTIEAVGLCAAWSAAVRQDRPDGSAAYSGAATVLGLLPETCVVVCPADEAPTALLAGPQKVLTITARAALERTADPQLSSRQRRVAELCALGLTDERIADELKVSVFIVCNDMAVLRRRFEVHDRGHVVARVIGAGLIDTTELRATLPAELPKLEETEKAVLALVSASVLDAASARLVGITTLREARNTLLRAIKKLTQPPPSGPRRRRRHRRRHHPRAGRTGP